jgi:hypothetical protein
VILRGRKSHHQGKCCNNRPYCAKCCTHQARLLSSTSGKNCSPAVTSEVRLGRERARALRRHWRAALHELTAGARVEKHAVELDAERAAVAAASGIATVHGNLFDTVCRVESFSFLYLNPSYDSEIGFMGNKRMEYLFVEHTFRWLVERCVADGRAAGAA